MAQKRRSKTNTKNMQDIPRNKESLKYHKEVKKQDEDFYLRNKKSRLKPEEKEFLQLKKRGED